MRRLLLLLFTSTPAAFAQPDEIVPLAVRLERSGPKAAVGFDVRNTFTETFRKRLNGGITSTAEILVELYDAAGNRIGSATRKCQLRLDIWDDILLVRITEPDKTIRKTFLVVDDGLAACGVVGDLAISDLSRLEAPAGYQVVVAVALNPISQELLERSREFSANPKGTSGRPDSLLGGFARLFHGKTAAGGETFLFRSQVLVRPK
jgi:hypothetical protein